MGIKKLQGKIDLKRIGGKAGAFLAAREALVLFVLLLALVGYCAYLWYAYAYSYQWDAARKQAYINVKNAGTTFDKDNFSGVIGNIDARQAEYGKNIDPPKDIFRLK